MSYFNEGNKYYNNKEKYYYIFVFIRRYNKENAKE